MREVNSVKYTWLKTPRYRGNGIGRLFNMLSFALRMRLIDLVDTYGVERPDVIIVSSTHPLHFFSGLFWARQYKVPLVFEVRDIWPDSLIQILGVPKSHPLCLLLEWVHRVAYKRADQVVSLLPNAASHMAERGLPRSRFNYIPNGLRISALSENVRSSHSQFLGDLKRQGAFIVMYTGAHGIPNALEPLVSSAQILSDTGRNDILFVLIGDGGRKDDLIKDVRARNLTNVFFLDSIPRDQVPDTLSYADVVFIGGKNLPLYEHGVSPNKMFEYMHAGKPILMTITSSKNPVDLAQAGTCVGSNDAEPIVSKLKEFASLPPSELEEMGRRGREFVVRNHSYDVLAAQYVDVIAKSFAAKVSIG